MRRSPRLMVVDDEIDICNFVKSFFELRGFQVSTALNGEEAMSKIQESQPEVILLDVVMREKDEGLVYLPILKQSLPSAKVMIVTGLDDEATAASAMKLGADDYITKPLVLEYLENTVLAKIKSMNIPAQE